jgi:Zn-finger protein
MTNDTEIVPCHENNDDIPTLQFDFCPISQVENKEKNDMIGNTWLEKLIYMK